MYKYLRDGCHIDTGAKAIPLTVYRPIEVSPRLPHDLMMNVLFLFCIASNRQNNKIIETCALKLNTLCCMYPEAVDFQHIVVNFGSLAGLISGFRPNKQGK